MNFEFEIKQQILRERNNIDEQTHALSERM